MSLLWVLFLLFISSTCVYCKNVKDDLGLNYTEGVKFGNEFQGTSLRVVPSVPKNFKGAVQTITSFLLTWDQPDIFNPDTDKYSVFIVQIESQSYIPKECEKKSVNYTDETIDTSYEYLFALTDYYVDVTVQAINGEGKSPEASTRIKMSKSPSNPPTEFQYANHTIIGETNVDLHGNFNWKYPCTPNGNVSFIITLEGEYTEDTDSPTKETINVDHTDFYDQTVDVSPYLNYSYEYTAKIVARNEAGTSSVETVSLHTDPNYPKEPKNVKITDDGLTLEITWEQPEGKVGKIVNYYLEIQSLGPGPDSYDCEPDTNITNYETNITTYQGRVSSYYNYLITLTAATAVGKGASFSQNYTTKTSRPPPPDEFNYVNSTIIGETNVDLHGNFNWACPCTPNGKLTFTIFLDGEYTEDSDIKMSENITIDYNEKCQETIDISSYLNYSYTYVGTIQGENSAGISDIKNTSFTTDPNYPEKPTISEIVDDGVTMDIKWEEPKKKVGKVTYYLEITSLGPEPGSHDCNPDKSVTNNETDGTSYGENIRAYYSYEINLTGATSVGKGESVTLNHKTNTSKSEVVVNLSQSIHNFSDDVVYNTSVAITFEPPCRTNGLFKSYQIEYTGERKNYQPHYGVLLVENFNTSIYDFILKPEYKYNFTVRVITEDNESDPESVNFVSPAGVPAFNGDIAQPTLKEYNVGELTLKKEFFSWQNGDIIYCGIILSSEPIATSGVFQYWDGKTWPETNSTGSSYVTKKMWSPFSDNTDSVKVEIGKDKELAENTKYYIVVRAFTSAAYIDSRNIDFQTGELKNKLVLILIITFSCLALLIIAILAFLVYKGKIRLDFIKRLGSKKSRKSSTKSDEVPYNKFTDISEKEIKEQFTKLNSESQTITKTNDVAVMPENVKKNRYKNILPFDSTRVKLSEEDSDSDGDYINASYINGYSGDREYIATQGPLKRTCKDFWKMIIQENVSLVVMAAHFVEKGSQKCYKYFPEVGEIQDVDDLSVKCLSEIKSNSYYTRHLQVKHKEAEKIVIHLQFLNWPDFGVPENIEEVINFCQEIRRQHKSGLILLHCSAGVGRTGTLLTLDIAMQGLNDKKDVNVEEIVSKLRKQRPLMVQTEGQYLFIHKCLAHYIKKNEKVKQL